MKRNICGSVCKLLIFVGVLSSPTITFAEQIAVHVKGMVCSFCVQGIKKKVGAIENVASVEVSLEKKLVSIISKDGASVGDAEIETAIKEAGYVAERIERSP